MIKTGLTALRSVVVCSSKRFKDNVKIFCDELHRLGVTVYEPSIITPISESEFIHSEYITAKVFKGLTLEHFEWIRKADACFIFNKNDYVGISTSMEMAFAQALGKPIFALSPRTGDPCRDSLIDKTATSPKELIRLLV
ncbi:MAG: hypothetical protein ACHQUB_01730 [Candidatus Saccharimonadia bacterium]